MFGGVAYIHVQPDAKQMELGAPHAKWQDFADEYLGFVADTLLVWGDSIRGVSMIVENYDFWLARSGRREDASTVDSKNRDRFRKDTGRRRVRAWLVAGVEPSGAKSSARIKQCGWSVPAKVATTIKRRVRICP